MPNNETKAEELYREATGLYMDERVKARADMSLPMFTMQAAVASALIDISATLREISTAVMMGL